jgi:hypothetical protein
VLDGIERCPARVLAAALQLHIAVLVTARARHSIVRLADRVLEPSGNELAAPGLDLDDLAADRSSGSRPACRPAHLAIHVNTWQS